LLLFLKLLRNLAITRQELVKFGIQELPLADFFLGEEEMLVGMINPTRGRMKFLLELTLDYCIGSAMLG
jgi:hypothetical protein